MIFGIFSASHRIHEVTFYAVEDDDGEEEGD